MADFRTNGKHKPECTITSFISIVSPRFAVRCPSQQKQIRKKQDDNYCKLHPSLPYQDITGVLILAINLITPQLELLARLPSMYMLIIARSRFSPL